MADWINIIIDWAENYLRYRDMIFRKIQELTKEKDRIIVQNKDGTKEIVLAMPELERIQPENTREPTIFITLNKKKNLKVLIDKWDVLSKIKEISVIFINPNSSLETKWIIRPFVHSRICDEASLKTGLKTMFETVEEIS